MLVYIRDDKLDVWVVKNEGEVVVGMQCFTAASAEIF